jgi:hypothetical protein
VIVVVDLGVFVAPVGAGEPLPDTAAVAGIERKKSTWWAYSWWTIPQAYFGPKRGSVRTSSSRMISPGFAPTQPQSVIRILISSSTRSQSNRLASSAEWTAARAASLPPTKT